jgi:uncharacterized protein (DUF2252 family)
MSTEDPADRARRGRAARARVPPDAHAHLGTAGRRSPVQVLGTQDLSRVPELVPLRHSRMLATPFTFYRGAAAVMAMDLAGTPASGLDVQLCGDAHLSNFGMFASPERTLLFDINDFDETLRGPWEWDLKRLVASLVVAGRENGLSAKQTRKVAFACATRYRDAMHAFAAMGNLAVWYSRVDAAEASRQLGDQLDQRLSDRVAASVAKAQRKDHLRALEKLTEVVDGRRRILADPPVVVPISHLAPELRPDEVAELVQGILRDYSGTLDPAHRLLVDTYTYVDLARKAVGVGSVGTRCWLVLMRGRDDGDPLFLQVKEAQASVLAEHLPPAPAGSAPRTEGERVVAGQRVMQAASDIFLGWHRTVGLDGVTRDFYVRQLHDWKGSAAIETMGPKALRLYGQLCAWTLARAHARSGDRIALAAYVGDDDALADALVTFGHAYADLNEADHATFAAAVAAGEPATSTRPSP